MENIWANWNSEIQRKSSKNQMNKDLEKVTNVDNVVLAMQKLLGEREKAKDTLKAIDKTIQSLVINNSEDAIAVNALLNLRHCKKFDEDHEVKIEKETEYSYHNGDLEEWYTLKCVGCKHDGCGCSSYALGRNGHGIRSMIESSIVLQWLSDGEIC